MKLSSVVAIVIPPTLPLSVGKGVVGLPSSDRKPPDGSPPSWVDSNIAGSVGIAVVGGDVGLLVVGLDVVGC